ncbi:glycosyltransferase family A protein [Mycobacterium sp. shizuoka-1]|uniref:glycosyltransferase family 2 protein n=1 Tax=Mycobacterium sp. shizuoka-1 TaxID=2039281 RepID=UPI000C05F1D5|nr:glycosyltransferase family A protein [Mycobacterium sp. shizuoka-1]GAY14027.1 hypothetical protein MSZK_07530 [Mycobacterium sp. shizuoka-1]
MADAAGGVAAVIPARPSEPYLAEAVGSVLRQPDVVDVVIATHETGSATAQLATTHPDPRVRLVISGGPSAGENLDAGVAATTAEWVAFLDADDCWPDGRVAAGLDAARSVPGAQMVVGHLREMDDDGTLQAATAPAPVPGTALVTREAVETIGGFGSDLIAQMRWMVRARDLGIVIVELPEVLLHRRGHAANLTRVQKPDLRQAYLALARERAARLRNPGQSR